MQTLNLTMLTGVQYGGVSCSKLYISFLLAAPVAAGVIISQTAQVYQPPIISQPAVMVSSIHHCTKMAVVQASPDQCVL